MGEKANALANSVGNAMSQNAQLVENPTRAAVESWIQNAVQWLRLGVETTGAIVIGIGILVAVWAFSSALLSRHPANFNAIRLSFARYLALGLEFQLGADILSTAITPSWEAIGRLAAIAIIRTGLNFFLMREIKEETERVEKNHETTGLSPTVGEPEKNASASEN